MNYIEAAEDYLRNCRHLENSISTMHIERDRLIRRAAPKGYKNIAVDLDIVQGGRFQKGGSVGEFDEILNLLWRIQELAANIKETESRIKEIKKILDDISKDEGCEQYGQVLRLWYIEKASKEDIRDALGYKTARSVYEIRSKAIRCFAVRILGIRALEGS